MGNPLRGSARIAGPLLSLPTAAAAVTKCGDTVLLLYQVTKGQADYAAAAASGDFESLGQVRLTPGLFNAQHPHSHSLVGFCPGHKTC